MGLTQNYLPPSGGSLVHPHLQVQLDDMPTQYHSDMINGAKRYFEKTGSNFWENLIEEEDRRGKRWIGRTGDWAWYTPFAPGGFKEVAAALPGRKSFEECTDQELTDLARGMDNVQQYYRSAGCNSFNFALYSISGDESWWTLCFRMLMRSNWEQWYRSDRTHHEVMLGEAAAPEAPERIAELTRPFFTG
jgi:galactose-1-phosphate uridylyltransferase